MTTEAGKWFTGETPSYTQSISGYGWIDDAGPSVNASGERLNVLESLVAQPHGHGERSCAVVTEHDDGLVGVEFLMSARGYLPHGHQKRAGEAGSLVLPRFAYIEQ